MHTGQLKKIKVRYSSLSLFMKNRELYEKVYVLGEPWVSTPAQVMGQALHKKLLEPDTFYDEFTVGAEAKHPFQQRFCELVAERLADNNELDFSGISNEEYISICEQSGYTRSSSITKWRELKQDTGIIELITSLYETYKTGVRKTPLSTADYEKVCDIVNKVSGEKFLARDNDLPGYFETSSTVSDVLGKSEVEVPIIMDYDDDIELSSRLDQIYIDDRGACLLIDYKFVQSVDGIEEKMFDYGYDLQAYLYSLQLYNKYRDIGNMKSEFDVRNVYIVVEKVYPYRVKWITFSRERLLAAKGRIAGAMEDLKECYRTDRFKDVNRYVCL